MLEHLNSIGGFLQVRDVAREIEFMMHPNDLKWSTERTDMFGRHWAKRWGGYWATDDVPEA